MVSDDEIVSGLETLLRQTDFTVTTSGDIRQQLERQLGVDLSHKRGFIRERIDLLVQSTRFPTSGYHHHHHQQQQQQHAHAHAHAHSHAHAHAHAHAQAQAQAQAQARAHAQAQAHVQAQAQAQAQAQFHLHHGHGHAPGVGGVGVAPFPPHCGGILEMDRFDGKGNFSCPNVKVDMPQASVVQELPKETSPRQVQSNAAAGGKRRGGAGGLNKLCGVSPELQAIVGEPAMTRTQIVKQLWAYIRKNNLQDPSNKRKIICNDALRLVFETDCTDMFKMNKLLAKHILPLDPAKDSSPDPKRLKASYVGSLVQGPAVGSSPVIISEALSKFLGTGESEMLQTEVIERVWNYIQMHHLQDPMNSMVTCDYRLQELFNCEKFPALGLSEMLLHHFLKR